MDNRFYVYYHVRNDSGHIFYVGKGSGRRLREVSNRKNPHWHNVVKKAGFTPVILLDNLDEPTALSYEMEFIAWCREAGYKLVNMTDGGESGVPTTETRLKMSTSAKLKPPISEKTRQLMSINNRGNKRRLGKLHNAATKAKMSRASKGKSKSASHSANIKSSWTVERRQQMSRRMKGNKSRTGMTNSPAHNAKVSAYMKGRPKTPEHLAAIAEARRRKKRNA